MHTSQGSVLASGMWNVLVHAGVCVCVRVCLVGRMYFQKLCLLISSHCRYMGRS